MIKQSQKHLEDTNERYFQHLRFALTYSASCLYAGITALIHGFIPALFQTAASEKVDELYNRQRTLH